jgi:hypothetical protein
MIMYIYIYIYQLVAQCFYLLIIAPTCFGLSCWPSSGSSCFYYEIVVKFMIISRWIPLRMRIYDNISLNSSQNENFSHTNLWRESKHIGVLWSVIFFPRKSCRLWGNVKKFCGLIHATGDNKIRGMRFACWRSEYAIFIALPPHTLVTRQLLHVTL